jgi:hypothetical protein
MRNSLVLIGLLAYFGWSSVALAIEGTVRLKNGGFVHGDMLEHLPGERVSVRTSDGTVRNIPWEEVERVEEGSGRAREAELDARPQPTSYATPAATPTSPGADAEPASIDLAPGGNEDRFNAVTLGLFGLLGVLGSASVDVEARSTAFTGASMTERSFFEEDLALSYGGSVQLDVPLHRHFSLAPQVRLTWWRPDPSESKERALFVDGMVAPRLRFPFLLSEGAIGVVYFQVPVGASYVDLPIDVSVSPAFALGVSGGFTALLSKHVGLALELGWLNRWFTTEEGPESGDWVDPVEYVSDWSVSQVTIQLGLVVAF